MHKALFNIFLETLHYLSNGKYDINLGYSSISNIFKDMVSNGIVSKFTILFINTYLY